LISKGDPEPWTGCLRTRMGRLNVEVRLPNFANGHTLMFLGVKKWSERAI